MESAATSSSNGRTLVLVGRTGNGKSATANSILLKNAFKSDFVSSGVTSSCELHQSEDKLVNVIDTPGLFDFTATNMEHGKEIIKCVNMANGGIHAVLFVLSATNRFSMEELAVIELLQGFFGDKITKYMIVVFTGGDKLEHLGKTLDDYLGKNCPKPLKELLQLCEGRKILFNNNTEDIQAKSKQQRELLNLVDLVVGSNGGTPFTNDLFLEMQECKRLRDELAKAESKKGEEAVVEQYAKLDNMVNDQLQAALQKLETRYLEDELKRAAAEIQRLRMDLSGKAADPKRTVLAEVLGWLGLG